MKSSELVPLALPQSMTGIVLPTGLRGTRVPPGLDGIYVTLSGAGFHYLRSRPQAKGSADKAIQSATWVRHEDVIAELNHPPSPPRAWRRWVALIVVGVVFLAIRPLLGILVLIIGWLVVKNLPRQKARASIYYDVDNPALLERGMLPAAACEALTRAQRVWVTDLRVGSIGYGALGPTVVSRQGWPLLRTNLETWTLEAAPFRILFLPDSLLVVAQGAVASFSYEELSIAADAVEVVEHGVPAGDGERVGTTYRHVTKSGRPDLRYRDNPAFPVMRYGRLVLFSQRGLYLAVQISRVDVAEYVAHVLRARAAISSYAAQQQPAYAPAAASSRGGTMALPVSGQASPSVAESWRGPSPTGAGMPAIVPLQTASPVPVATAPGAAVPSSYPHAATVSPPAMQAQRPGPSHAGIAHAASAPTAGPIAAIAATPAPVITPSPAPPPPRPFPAKPAEPPLRAAERVGPSRMSASWVPPGQSVRVGRWVIPDGMVYVGENLPRVSGHGTEPALIVPSAECAPPTAASREDFGYWPSYLALTPEKRAAYLNWLAGGRKDPDAVLGWPFLFLYGIERRLLHDFQRDPAVAYEVPILLREVERLLAIYGPQSGSFQSYAGGLIDFWRVYSQSGPFYAAEPPLEFRYEVPLVVKAALGQLVAEEKPIPARWALAWLMGSPIARFRTPAKRCRDEFIALFVRRYEQRYGAGMRLRRNKTLLRIEYKPASASFGGPVEVVARQNGETLPDVTRATRPLLPLMKLADECTDALDAYSRALGPSPTRDRQLRAIAFLPAELEVSLEGPVAGVAAWLAAKVTGEMVLVRGDELIRQWLGTSGDKLGAQDARALGTVFERLGYGVEPDPRFGGEAIRASGQVALFRLPQGASAQPTSAYVVMSLWLRLATHVALADGHFDQQEEALLHKRINDMSDADDVTRRRLHAHLEWLVVEKPGLRGLAKRVGGLPFADKRRIGQLVVAMAGADGRIDPSEVATLTRIYKLLGLDETGLFEDIHELQAAGNEVATRGPVRVREASPSTGFAIPQSGDANTGGGFELDMDKIRRKEAESRAVAELLSNIFEDDDEPSVVPPEAEEAPDSVEPVAIVQTTNVDRGLLEELASKASWARADFDALVQRYGMMPNAAVDSINEFAIECTGDPVLIVEGDVVEVDADIMHELMNDV